MLRRYWPDGSDPIGLKILVPEMKLSGNAYFMTPPTAGEALEIIGIVGTARNRGLHDPPKPAIFVPYTLVLGPGCAYVIRTQGDPHKLANALREQVHLVDADQPVNQLITLEELLARGERT